jgi:hypothetical protein
MFRGRLGRLSGFNELFQIVSHGDSILESIEGATSFYIATWTKLQPSHNGKLSCFFAGISTFLSFSIASARAIRFLVECGMMTSSM